MKFNQKLVIKLTFNNNIMSKLLVDKYGTKRWYKNGLLHREQDKPAIIYENGDKEWWINGKRHRENDKPSVIWVNDPKCWQKNSEYHRLLGYSIYHNGYKWIVKDKWLTNGNSLRIIRLFVNKK